PIYTSHATSITEFATLSLHDALPISIRGEMSRVVTLAPRRASHVVSSPWPQPTSRIRFPCTSPSRARAWIVSGVVGQAATVRGRSEEHTSELQSRSELVCRLLLEKKK